MSQDYIALEWVKGEIEETLQQAQQALETYVDNPTDKSRLKFCLSYLHQIHGTLQMVEFYGAALLAEEMEAVAAFIASEDTDQGSALEILMQSIIQLPHYLQHVKVGRRDLPVVLLPILNELRSARGESYLQEGHLFAPTIRHNPLLTAQQIALYNGKDFRLWVQKVRQMLQAAMLQLLQNKQPQVAKQYLSKVFARLHKALGNTPQGKVWLPALAFSEWLQKEDVLPKTVKQILGQLERQLRAVLEEGAKAINRAPDDELIRSLLLFIAESDANSEAIRATRKEFALGSALLSEEDVQKLREELAGPDRHTVDQVLHALIEEIAAVKDRLDLLVRGKDDRSAALADVEPLLKQISDTMMVLGLGMPRKVLQEQQSKVARLIREGEEVTDSYLMDIAGALLYVEATLSGMKNEGGLHAKVSESSLTDAQQAVLREARNVLEQVKDAIVEYVAKQWSAHELAEVPSLLHSIEGSLSMIPLPRVAGILSRAAAFVQQQLIEEELRPQWSVLDNLADVLTGVEYFIERYSEKPHGAGEDALVRAEESLAELPATEPLSDIIDDINLDYDEPAEETEVNTATSEEFIVEQVTEVPNQDGGRDDSDFPDEKKVGLTSESEDADVIGTEVIELTPVDEGISEEDDLIDDEIIEIFLEEAQEVTETLDQYWPQFKTDRNDQEALTTVRRAFHTLKGSGRMVQAEMLGELAWSVENMFNRVLDETISISDNLVALVDYVISQLPTLIDDFRHHRQPSIAIQPLMEYAFALAGNEVVEPFIHHLNLTAEPCADNDSEKTEEDEDAALLDVFVNEANTHLLTVAEFIQQSRDQSYAYPLSDHLQRALHTLKGSAHMAGITGIAEVAAPLERLIKELRAYQVKNATEIVDLVEEGEQLIRAGLTNDSLLELQTIDGSEAFVERLQQMETLLLEPLIQAQQQGSGGPTPQTLATFLSQGMDSLLDADELLRQWQQQGNEEVLLNLSEDLKQVAQGATRAELPHIKALADALNLLYDRMLTDQVQPESDLLELLSQAQEALLGMMDCLAAGQQTQPEDELIERLSRWQFSPKTENADVEIADIERVADEISVEEIAAPVLSDLAVEEAELPPVVEVADEYDEICDIFLEEAEEVCESIEGALERWQQQPDNLVGVAQLQRELHTLKGGARMAELQEVAELCHELETLYEKVNDGRLTVTTPLFSLLQRSHDALNLQLDTVRQGGRAASEQALIAEICQYGSGVPQTVRGTKSKDLDAVPDEQETTQTEQETTPDPVADVVVDTLDESDREILEIFLEEAHELQEQLDKALNDWHQEPENHSFAGEAQRILHTLKGGARLAGLSAIGDQAHDFEANILKAQQGNIAVDDTLFKHYYRIHDELAQKIEAIADRFESGDYVSLDEKAVVVDAEFTTDSAPTPVAASERIDTEEIAAPGVDSDVETNVVPLRPETAVAEQPEPTAQPQSAAARKAPNELVKVSAELLDNLVNLAGETSIGRGRIEQQVTDFSYTIDEMDMTLDRLRDQLRRLDMETEAQVLFRQERQGPQYDDFDPLEMDRYSAMQQLSRALVESASDLLDLKDTLSNKTRDAETLLLQQSRVNTELQEGLMKTRMVPFQRLVPRLRRIVRQISLELDKQVELRVFNADGEMDRTILERLVSPLEHMVRNAVDHGMETEVQRRAVGKSAIGNIELDISRDGGDIVLTLRDDGRGVNIDAVRKKAIERGLMSEEADLSDDEITQFILLAGFSTAEQVTQISGRGVGMDVVSSEIKQMGGSVAIRSQRGQGTEFIVRLPFTVSVNRALMVRVGDDLYAVPLNNIQGIVRASVAELEKLYALPSEQRSYTYAGNDYRLEYLGNMLDNETHPKFATQNLPLPVLLIRGAVPFALQVDSLLGSREIVVKALGPQFASVMGVSGGTILGDGSVVIILDLPAMIRTQSSLEYQHAKALDVQNAERRYELENRLPRILVVDDSVTVRKVTTRLLERSGMEVYTAKDGVDAMATLQDHKPDLMLLDIEMPRMDGFEVASQVRHDSRLSDIPIIMITSRTGDKHRERAISIGVNEYLGKPFQEDVLLATMNRLLGRQEN